MDIRVTKTKLDGVLIIDPDCFRDDRGFFFESYSKGRQCRARAKPDVRTGQPLGFPPGRVARFPLPGYDGPSVQAGPMHHG